MDFLGNYLGFHSLVNLDRTFSGVQDHKAIRTGIDMGFQLAAKLRVDVLIQVLVELLKKLFTGKQKYRPLSA